MGARYVLFCTIMKNLIFWEFLEVKILYWSGIGVYLIDF